MMGRIGQQQLWYLNLLFLLSLCFLDKTVAEEMDDIEIVRLGYIENAISQVNKADANTAMEILFNKIVLRNLPKYRSESAAFTKLPDAIQAFRTGKLDILAMTSIDYLKAHKKINMIPSFVTHKGKKPEDEYLLVVHKEKGIENLKQLQDKIIFVEKGFPGDVSLMWLDTLLIEHSLKQSDIFFKNVKRVLKGSKAALSVFFEQADAGLVRQSTYENLIAFNPQLEKKLKVLHRSPGYLLSVIVFHPDLDEKIYNISKDIYDKIDDYPEGKQIFMLLHIKKFSIYKPEYLKNIEMLYNKLGEGL